MGDHIDSNETRGHSSDGPSDHNENTETVAHNDDNQSEPADRCETEPAARCQTEPANPGRSFAEFALLAADELRAMAGAVMRGERPDHTLQPTAVVSEVWLRAMHTDDAAFASREAFLAFAAKTMRHVLIDHARRRNAVKRGAGRVTRLGDHEPGVGEGLRAGRSGVPDRDIGWMLALEDELRELESLDTDAARVVELRFYGGLTVAEAASVLGVSTRTVQNRWVTARAWLKGRLDDGQADT